MKKIVFSLVMAGLLFNSCSSDDDNNPPANATVDGTWKLTAWTATDGVDINNDGTASTNLLSEFDCYDNETLVFTTNNVVIVNSTSYADITVELVTGTPNEYTFSVDCIEESDSFPLTWSMSGNTITFNDGFEDVVGTLSGNQISILIEEGFEAYDPDTFETVVLQDITFVYTKQ